MYRCHSRYAAAHIIIGTLISMAHATTIASIAGVAEAQLGLVTRRQAELAGVAPATFARQAAAGKILRRVAHGVYLVAGAPVPDNLALRAAWLRLAPETPAWKRLPSQGVVSHRSAAALYGLGELPADLHEFTLPERRQADRAEVRIHRGSLALSEWQRRDGLLVTTPARTAADLLADYEDPEAVGRIAGEILRRALDSPDALAAAISPSAARFGLRSRDGVALLRRLLEMAGDPDLGIPVAEAQASSHIDDAGGR